MRRFFMPALCAGLLIGCAEDTPETETPAEEVAVDPELTDLDLLLEGAPENHKLPDEAKADGLFPAQFDLHDTQSPVRNQSGRGVCSIFSTIGLMEHLYIKEGTLTNPDFSEQFLQWSSKIELGAFPKTGGSNAGKNLDAIRRYGVVFEEVAPYEGSKWTTAQDERCTGDDRPTICYTNGEPSEAALAAKRWHLPRGRWVNANRRNIKAVMHQEKIAVVAGMQFFYQSWNHGGSKIPTSSDYMAHGYVLAPNAKDRELSSEKRAGHSILIVGWDDDLEVQSLDADGKPMVDADGNPVMQKGFFLIKNSWGTGRFGTKNPFGAGYGWLAMDYVEEFASINTARQPTLNFDPEQCDDGFDNDYDGLVDCDDEQCGQHPACLPADGELFESTPGSQIPDNNEAGVTDGVTVAGLNGFVQGMELVVDIKHPFRGDLRLTLTAPDGRSAVVRDQEGGTTPDLKAVINVTELFLGAPADGEWTLTVADTSRGGDLGTVESWAVNFTAIEVQEPTEICDDGIDNDANGNWDCFDVSCGAAAHCQAAPQSYEGDDLVGGDIPDNDGIGLRSTITLDAPGRIEGLSVLVDVNHTYIGDLTIKLIHPDGTHLDLHTQEGGSADNLSEIYEPADFDGKLAAGEWTLWLIDSADQDVGTLTGWTLEATTR